MQQCKCPLKPSRSNLALWTEVHVHINYTIDTETFNHCRTAPLVRRICLKFKGNQDANLFHHCLRWKFRCQVDLIVLLFVINLSRLTEHGLSIRTFRKKQRLVSAF